MPLSAAAWRAETMPNCALESLAAITPDERWCAGFFGSKSLTRAVVRKRRPGSGESAPGKLGSKVAMPVRPAYSESRRAATELPIGVMHPRPVTTTRFIWSLRSRGFENIRTPRRRAAWRRSSLSTPRTTSPTVLSEFRLSSGISIENISSTAKLRLILSSESICSSSNVVSMWTSEGWQVLRVCDEFDDTGLDVVHGLFHVRRRGGGVAVLSDCFITCGWIVVNALGQGQRSSTSSRQNPGPIAARML